MHRWLTFVFCSLLFAISLCGLATNGIGQTPERDLGKLRFKPLDLGGNAPSGQARGIIQGPNGFIWFGTQEGAHRFDGYELRTFSNEKNNPASLVNSVVRTFHVDHRDRIWIGTERGIAYFIPETESFRNYYLDPESENSNLANHVNAIVRDSSDEIYVSSEGGYVYRFDEVADRFEPVGEGGLGIIKSMVIDPKDRIWIGADGQLHMLDLNSGLTATFREAFEDNDPTVANFIESISYVEEDQIWLGTASQGAVLFDSNTSEVVGAERELVGESYAHFIEQDEDGNIWIGHSSGLTIFERKSARAIRYHPELRESPLPGSAIISVLRDKQGNIWAGSAFHGIFVATNNKRFDSLPDYLGREEGAQEVISSILEDRDGNLWVGKNSAGIDVFPADRGEPFSLEHESGNLNSIWESTVFCLYQDSYGEIWAGTYRGGLFRYRPETRDFDYYRNIVGDERSLAGNDIRGIQEDEKGNLWILAHGQGISYFDRAAGTFSTIRHDEKAPEDSLIDDWAYSIHYRSSGHLLVGTAIGLSVLDTSKGKIVNFVADSTSSGSLSNSVVNTIFEDSKGRLWLGTADGINRFDLEAGRFEYWSKEDGLPNRVVQSIIEDGDGLLWIGTNSGLARFNPEDGKIDAYDKGDGLSDDAFYGRASILSRDGRLYFGTRDGVTVFDPSAIEENKSLPEVWVNEFKVFNQPLNLVPGGDGIGVLDRSILETERIVLRPDQKVITIGFVGLNYIQSSKNEYAYRLKGFNSRWSFVGTRREATYTNLNPGTYTFQVKASNDDGYWSEVPRELEIVVLPPLWGTTSFRLGAILLIISIPAVLVYLRVKATKRQQAELESRVGRRTEALSRANQELELANSKLAESQNQIKGQNAELIRHRENLESMVSMRTEELETAKAKAERSDRLKSAFLANMSHEIRTPMNAIIGLLDVLQLDSLTQEEREQYTGVIRQSSETLMTLIDDILDLSRIESGEANIQLQDCNCDELCEELYALFRHVAERESEGKVSLKLLRNGVENSRGGDETDLVLPGFDPVRLKQILTNLLSNAIKFTEEGVISLGYETMQVGSELCIRFFVTDVGIGIAEEQVSRIFDRFHKAEAPNGRVYRGTGLGLTISKRLTEMMDGEIRVESKEGEGTSFFVEFKRRVGRQDPNDSIESEGISSAADDATRYFGKFEGRRALVAEDEVPNYLVIEKFLAKSGVELVWAKNGEEAIASFDQGTFDIVLLDVKMPIKNGYQVLNHIRSVDTNIPVLVQTAHAMEEDRRRAMRFGANNALAKPYSQLALLREIDVLLAGSDRS